MNIEFNVLWFEDTDEWYEATKDEIESYIVDLCFQANFVRYKNLLDNDLEKILLEKKFDLIFVDLNLSEGDNGSQAIQLIRGKKILSDALFYSTDGIEKIKKVMKDDILEGVYLSPRDEIIFLDKAKKLIDKITKRAEDILNVRGMLMDSVSEFDYKIKEIIRKILSVSKQSEINAFNEYAFKEVRKQIEKNDKKIKELEENFLLNALNKPFLIDSFKLSKVINKIFKDKYPDLSQMKNFHTNYDADILKERNRLAHSKKEQEKNEYFCFKESEKKLIVYDSKKCRKIRKDINNYNLVINQVINYINEETKTKN